MGVRERYEKRKKDEVNESNSKTKKTGGVRERFEQRNFASSLPERLESLASTRNELSQKYNSRFFDKDGKFINSYRNDTKNALSSFETSKANASKEYESLVSDLAKYGKYLDADKVKSLEEYLSSYNADMQSMYNTYKVDSDNFSPYKDEDTYNRAVAYEKEQDKKVKKYSSMTDDDLSAELEKLKNSKKGNKFTNSALKLVGVATGNDEFYAEGDENSKNNVSLDNDITLVEAEITNRKYAQLDKLPKKAKTLVDELTELESSAEETEFQNDANAILSGFTGGSNVNYATTSSADTDRYKEITKTLEDMGISNWGELVAYNKIKYNEEKNASAKQEYKQMAEQHPILSSLVSVPASLGQGLGVVEMLENIDSDTPIDPNSAYFGMNNFVNTVRETVMDNYDYHLNTGIDVIDNLDVFDELYGVTTSMGDSVTAGLTGGLGGVTLGLSAASNSAQEIAEKGGSANEVVLTGLVAGLNEMLWESVSLGQLNKLLTKGVNGKGFKGVVKEILKSTGINASEEFNTEAANIVSDYIINGGASTYSDSVNKYLTLGYTDSEAKFRAKKDMSYQMAHAGVSGALQGLLMGAGGTIANKTLQKLETDTQYKQTGREVLQNNGLQSLITEAEGLGNTKQADMLNRVADSVLARENGKVKSSEARKVGRAYTDIARSRIDLWLNADKKAVRNIIRSTYESSGVTDVEKAMSVTEKKIEGKSLTKAEQSYFDEINGTEVINTALSSDLNPEVEKVQAKSIASIVNMDSLAAPVEKRSAQIDATGETVEITGIVNAGSQKSAPVVRLNNDTEVSLDELNVDDGTKIVFESVAELNDEGLMDSNAATLVYDTFTSRSFNPSLYMKGVTDALRYGQMGYKVGFETNSLIKALPKDLSEFLYDKGRQISQENADSKTKAIKSKSNKDFNAGKVRYAEGVDYNNLNKKQKAQVDLLKVIIPELGMNVEFFESKVVNGQRIGENGSYSPSQNLLRIDVAAGNNGEGLLLFTASHELTHFIQAWSPSHYKKFADFLVETYAEKGVKLEDLIKNKIKQSQLSVQTGKRAKALTYTEAYDEVVADACESFLRDGDISQKLVDLAKKDKTLANKVREWLKKFVDIVKKALAAVSGIDPQSTEASITLSLDEASYNKLINLWESALMDARTNNAKNMTAQKNTTGKGDVKNADRTFSYDELIAKGSIQGIVVDKKQQAKFNTNGDLDIHYVFNCVKAQCEKIQTNAPEPTYYLNVPDIGKNVEITNDGIKHGFIKWKKTKNGNVPYRSVINARAALALPQILKTSIEVNRSDRNDADVNFTHIMMGTIGLEDTNGTVEYYAVRSMIQDRVNQDPLLVECEVLGKLYATNAKKIDSPRVQTTKAALAHSKVYAYNITDFLEDVKDVFDNTFSEDVYQHFGMQRKNDDFAQNLKFSLRSNVEETKELVAVHGMTIQNLMSSLELGGLPMPSIAIIKARMGHNKYGDVSLVFGKDTIDPELNNENKVYGLDVWSPVYPTIEFKVNEAVASKIQDKYYELGKKYGYDDVRPLYAYAEELERQLNNAEGEQGLLEDLYNDVGLMKVYLLDSGKPKVEPVTVEERTALSDMDVESIEYLIGEIGRDIIDEFVLPEGVPGPWAQEHKKAFWDKHLDEVKKAYRNMFIDLDNFTEEDANKIVDNTSRLELNNWLKKTVDYIKNGKVKIKVTEDKAATEEAIKKAAQDGYVEWVNDLFKGVAEKSGIRNNVDYIDNYGNRRDWEALHYANKLENVVKVMKGQENGSSFFNAGALWSIAAKDYGTIKEIKEDSGRLELLSEDEYSALKKAIGARVDEIADSLNSKYSDSNYFIEHDNKINNLFDAIKSSKTKSGVLKYLNEYFTNATESTVTDLLDVIADAGNLPTEYFEAKPQRAVMFDEVKAVIIPDNAPQELREQLDSMGLNVLTYEHGNDNSRTEVLNSIEDVKFQDRVTPEMDAEYLELAKNPEKNESRLREMVDEAAENSMPNSVVRDGNGKLLTVYHGSPSKFTVFDHNKMNVHGNAHGRGFYFTEEKSLAEGYQKNDGQLLKGYLNITNPMSEEKVTIKKPDLIKLIQAICEEEAKNMVADEGYGSVEDALRDTWVSNYVYTYRTSINNAYKEAADIIYSNDNDVDIVAELTNVTDTETVLKKVHEVSGYDGVIYTNERGTHEYVSLISNQFKSSDPVTYDDSGNIIPLSERFNEGNDDIRYQDRPYQPSPEDLGIDYKSENDKLRADVDRLNNLLKLQKTLTHGALFTKTSVDKVASLIMKDAGLRKGKQELSDKLNELYSFIASSDDLTWDEIYDRSSGIANWIIDNLPEQNVYKNPYALNILRDIRETEITFNDTQKAEAAYYAGSFNIYRKMNFGNFKIVNEGGITLTELWEQLTSDYYGIIDKDIIEKGESDANIPVLLVELIEDLRQTENLLEQMDKEQEVRKISEKIYDMYWNVTTLHTLADKHQKEVNLLKSKHRNEMDAIKERNESKLNITKERYRDMLKKIRDDRDAKMSAYKERVAEQRHRNVEGRRKTEVKNKFKRVVKELDKLLNKGNKKANVKDGMQDMVAQAIALSDLLLGDTIPAEYILSADIPDVRLSGNESELLKKWQDLVKAREGYQKSIDDLEAKYGSDMPMETYENLVNSVALANRHIKATEKALSGLLERERKRLNATGVKNAIESLSKAYEMLKDSNTEYISGAYDEYISNRLKTLVETLDGVTINDMSLADLQEVYTAYKMVLSTVRNANKLFVDGRKEDFDEINSLVLQEINAHPDKKESAVKLIDKALELRREFTFNNLKPLYFFENLGSDTLKRIFYDELARAQKVYGRDWQEARKYIESAREKHNYYSWGNDSQSIKLLDGRTVRFSMQELMSIYAYSKRPQAELHMSEGGFAFDTKAFFKDRVEEVDGKKVKTRELRSNGESPYKITEYELNKIKKMLGKERCEYVDEMQEYLSKDMAKKGNSVTQVLYGIDIFNESVYFPLKSNKDYKIPVSTTNAEFSLKGSGFTKETVPSARNPIVLEGFENVWSRHVNEMATYHSLVLPIENMNKVLGYNEYINTPVSLSTKQIIRKVYGDSALNYIENYIQDMNGGFNSSKGAGNLFAKGFSNFKKTAVGASMSTVIQQPTAIIRAMAEINPKYFVGYENKNHKALQEEMLKYAPISIIKQIGGFDTGGNRSAVNALISKDFVGIDKAEAFFKDEEYRKEKFDDAIMLGATKADEIGWNIIWNAVKNEVKDTTMFIPGTEEFLNAVGNRFDEVINATQVYDSVLSRSGYMRSNNELVKMSTAFMGEPTTSFNMLYNAVLQAKRGKMIKSKAVGTISSVFVSIIFAAAFKSAIYALRDDDDDESYVEKYMSALSNSLKEELWIHNMLPFVSDITSMFQGWDVERTDMAAFKDIYDAFNGLDSDSKTPYRKAEDLFGAFAGLFGIPLKNMMRTGREVYNFFENILDDDTPSTDKVAEAIVGKKTASDVNDALKFGRTEKAKEIINEIIVSRSRGATNVADAQKQAKASVKASVTSEWKPKYLEAYAQKDDKEMARIRKLLHSTGLYDDIIETCREWVIKNQE